MVESFDIHINENILIDFQGYFEGIKASEFLRSGLLESIKKSREFLKTKNMVYQREKNGENEMMLDYKKFSEYNISIQSDDTWRPENMDGTTPYTLKLGDKLYILFKNYANFTAAITISNMETQITDLEEIREKLESENNDKLIQNVDSRISASQDVLKKSRGKMCIEQYLTDNIINIMTKKIYSEEDKELVEESKEIAAAEAKENEDTTKEWVKK